MIKYANMVGESKLPGGTKHEVLRGLDVYPFETSGLAISLNLN